MTGFGEAREGDTAIGEQGASRARERPEDRAVTGKKEKKKKGGRKKTDDRLAAAEKEVSEYRENLIRLQAEFENYKKRQAKEREEGRKSANERLLKEFLPVLDNLERAVEHSLGEADTDKMLQGVQLVLKQFRDGLSQFGVEPIEAEGALFDPHIHEAMSRVETEGDPPDGTVVEVYQKGYLLYGRVLRPAMVGVAKLVDEGETQG